MPSDIHVFVRFAEPSVFAGEEVKCVITFKNVANVQEPAISDQRSGKHSRRASLIEQSAATYRAGNAVFKGSSHVPGSTNQQQGRNNTENRHKARASLSLGASSDTISEHLSLASTGTSFVRPTHKHQRSISIISIGSPDVDNENPRKTQLPQIGGPAIDPSRTASKQGASNRGLGSDEPQPTGLYFPEQSSNLGARALKPGSSRQASRSESRRSSPSFTLHSEDQTFAPSKPDVTQATKNTLEHNQERGSKGTDSEKKEPLPLSDRVVSGASIASSARSSGEFQSLSNHSQETLASEQAYLMAERPRFPSNRIRQHYRMDSVPQRKPQTAKLLMGYAQVVATFTLDGSLVDQSPFEEVKRKGFLGGQAGGGVVGVKGPQTTGGFLGGFNLNIGGSLGGGDLSSLKEMRNVTSARAIPLLSTPQSLLFVDLQLAPGDERSFSFAYTLPQGLPSSHRGKALKVVYQLAIGVQGAQREKDVQAVRRINIPFRVFSGVNPDGEIFGHDLMQPYVILRDSAHTEPIDEPSQQALRPSLSSNGPTDSSTEDFLAYVDTLLDRNRRRQSSSGTLEPSHALANPNDPHLAKQAINRAILFSNQIPTDVGRSPNRFDIARNAAHVAVIILNRSSHRLGENVVATVDFSGAQMQCYSVRAALETTEKVNPALALRSAVSISRVTRRIYASHIENTLFARRIIFSPFIPVTATPTLLTSGVNLNWGMRFEFTTVSRTSPQPEETAGKPDLLEEIVKDERGSIFAAAETVDCDTFEVTIPITVYGDVVTDGMEEEEIMGLPI